MKKRIPRFLALILLAAGVSAFAQDKADSDKASIWQKMDFNKDGMISKDEYMKYREGQWNTYKKNNDGMLDLKDLQHGPKKTTEWEGSGKSQ